MEGRLRVVGRAAAAQVIIYEVGYPEHYDIFCHQGSSSLDTILEVVVDGQHDRLVL